MSVLLDTPQGCEVLQDSDRRVHFLADADIDADGANGQSGEWAYKPFDKGLEALANAGFPTHPEWYRSILVCNKRTGAPVLFDGGGFVSRTSYEWAREPHDTPRRFVDASAVPYIVVNANIRRRAKGIVLGCLAKITNTHTGRWTWAVVADIGPLRKIGEISMAAARSIDVPWNPRSGGASDRIIQYELWPGTPADVQGVTYDLLRAA
jgi:hypothetical protein